MYTTFLASAFRSLRFGLGEAHGKGMALQLNTLLDAGAFRVDKAGTFSVDPAKVKDAVKALTGEIMAVQAAGDRKPGSGAAPDAGGHPARGPEGARPPTDCPGGHRAPVHNGGGTADPGRKKLNRTPCQRRLPCHSIEPAVLKARTWFRRLCSQTPLRLPALAVDESSLDVAVWEASPAVGLGPGDRAAGADHARPSRRRTPAPAAPTTTRTTSSAA